MKHGKRPPGPLSLRYRSMTCAIQSVARYPPPDTARIAISPIETERLTGAWFAPVRLSAIFAHPGRAKHDVASLRWFVGGGDRVVVDVLRKPKLELPAIVVTTLAIHMRLNLLASGRFLTMQPARMVHQRANKAWLRALSIDFPESADPIAAFTVRKRGASGALKLPQ